MFLTKTNYYFEKVAVIRGLKILTSVKLCLYKAGSSINKNEGAHSGGGGHYYNVSPVTLRNGISNDAYRSLKCRCLDHLHNII